MKVISRISHLGLLAGILAIFSPGQSSAQCVNTATGANCARSSSTFTVEILPNSGCGNFTTSGNYSPGTYFRLPVLNGACYTISTCGAPFDTQIGCFQGVTTSIPFAYNDDNGPVCNGTAASVNMVPNFTDYARIDVRQYNCQPGGSSSINVNVRQNNNLSITSSNAAMCQGQTRTLTAVPAPVTVTPPAGAGNVGTFTGTGVSGTTFTGPTPSGPGQSYNITYTFGYCSATSSISVFHAPSTSNAGTNQTVCASSASISANNPAFGSGEWTVVSGSGTVTTPTSPSTSVTGLVAGQSVTLRWTISNGPCTPSTDDVIITREVEPTQAVVGPDQQVCTDTVQLAGNLPSVGSGSWSVLSGTGTFSSTTNPNPTVTGLALGQNKYVWTISNGVCPVKRDTVTVQRDDQAPTPFAGPDKTICGSSTTLTGNIPPFGNGTWVVVSGSGIISNPNQPNSTINSINVGTTVVTWNIGNGTCPVRSDTMVITRHPLPTAPAISGGQTICYGSSATLTASSAASSPTYLWWDAATGGNLLASGSIYTTPALSSNITVYAEVEDGVTTCVSARTPYALTVSPLPSVSLGPDTTICSDQNLCLNAGAGMSSYLWNTGATTQTICTNVSGTYYVVVTDANGCDAYDTINVIAYAPPVVNLGPDQTLCTGSTRTLTVPNDPNNTYQWSTGASTNSITVSSGGTYGLTVTNQYGCESSDEIIVNQFNAPVAAFSIDSAGCPVISFSDQSTDASSWTWSFGTGATAVGPTTSYNYQNSGNGLYQVAMIANGICGSDTAYHTINIDCIVGIELPNSLDITVFPNPNNGYFKMLIGGLESDASLEVYDLLGKKVYEKDLSGIRGSHEEAIDIRHASKGIYLAKLKVGELSIVKRIVVE